MAESEKQQRQATIAKIYHSKIDFKNATGVDVGPTGDKVIAGTDDRKDVFSLSEDDSQEVLQRKLVASTVILTGKNELTKQADGTFTLAVDPFRMNNLPPCSGERFGNQNTGGWCSGFMVGSDLIVTAGHCGKTDAEIQDTAYVFGFRVDSPDDTGTTNFSANQVYFGKELIAHDLSPTGDFAIVRVDREITAPGAVALKVRDSGAIGLGRNIGVIGHPSGLPVKVAFGAATVVMKDQDPWLFANLDTYGGNSGSAVFNQEGLVEGILVRGARDYDLETTCFKSNKIMDSDGSEAVTKASAFVNKIPG